MLQSIKAIKKFVKYYFHKELLAAKGEKMATKKNYERVKKF